jgi:hypothetical protein
MRAASLYCRPAFLKLTATRWPHQAPDISPEGNALSGGGHPALLAGMLLAHHRAHFDHVHVGLDRKAEPLAQYLHVLFARVQKAVKIANPRLVRHAAGLSPAFRIVRLGGLGDRTSKRYSSRS